MNKRYRALLIMCTSFFNTTHVLPMHSLARTLAPKTAISRVFVRRASNDVPKTLPKVTNLLKQAIVKYDVQLMYEILSNNKERLLVDPEEFRVTYFRLGMIKALLKAGLDPNTDGVLPLHRVVAKRIYNDDVVEFIKRGADVNAIDKDDGMTPLMVAARGVIYPDYPEEAGGNFEGVKILLRAGAKKDLKCVQGLTALDYAHTALEKGEFESIYTDRAPIRFTQEETKEAKRSYHDIIKLLK